MNNKMIDALTREAMRDDDAFERLVADIGADKVRASLARMRNDVRWQEVTQHDKRSTGEISTRQMLRWQIKARRFKLALKRRLAEIQVDPHNLTASYLPDDTRQHYRKIVMRMALAVDTYLDDPNASDSILEDLLDERIPFGPNQQRLSLADAISEGIIRPVSNADQH
ncbi:hypothetical protein GCM10027059_50080 [Myceligenerans halotolerans]